MLPFLLVAPVDDGAVRQVIVVRSDAWHSARATLRRFENDGHSWKAVGTPAKAWIGSNGVAPRRERRQNSGQTPAGVFPLPSAFGSVSGRRLSLPFHRVTPTSYWPYDPRDPRTYNVLQSKRSRQARWRDDGQWSERLVDYGRAYRLAVVIGYNLPGSVFWDSGSGEWRTREPAKTHKGGGIFLHVQRGRPTAGCVAVSLPQMRTTARWLDPRSNPRIVIGTRKSTRDWRARVLP